ncbi:hypothetical protein BT96DRAFT_153031 [Gymnopus androsaceus JB14]|uniref:VWFA domain-containing protein n=1 Tax=Gymnopus androsaceus JB14 TaxID=1447944 RepID=A0A6A4I9F1_9AGAR|nr:hypothetical protein BT96DRAFT_153031 [Gymnopus androsaceus JB14]
MQGSLWAEARLALSSIADTASKFDEDGIDIHFINSKKEGLNVKSSRQVMDLFDSIRPYGSTYLGRTLDVLLGDYLDEIEAAKPDKVALRKIKPKNFIVITDGEPSDDPEEVIANAAKRLDAGKFPLAQLGIQLVQIGRGEEAKRYLNRLDNTLTEKYQIRDIVDTTPYFGQISHDALIKIMLGGINRKMDRSKA